MLTTSTYESDVTTLPRALGSAEKSYRWQCVVAPQTKFVAKLCRTSSISVTGCQKINTYFSVG